MRTGSVNRAARSCRNGSTSVGASVVRAVDVDAYRGVERAERERRGARSSGCPRIDIRRLVWQERGKGSRESWDRQKRECATSQ